MGRCSDFASPEQGRVPAASRPPPRAALAICGRQAVGGLPVHQRLRFLVERGVLTRIPPSARLLARARAVPGATIYANNREIVSFDTLSR